MYFVLIQLIGAIAYTTIAASYYKKEKKKILFLQILAYIFFTIHYYLLSGITGVICNLIGLLALIGIYIFDKYKLKNKKLIVSLFVLLLIIANITTFQNIYSFFPMIASVISIISFLSDKENNIRIVGSISALCWLIYAIVYKSYITIFFEVVTLIITLIALIKNKSKTN